MAALLPPAPRDHSSRPDVMNDPEYATNSPLGEDGLEDLDTCRICRGEGGDAEPLFHPCKCSGSIKHVHQDCLMEWLSHSQKKHCELCKTPFRFTKIYSPDMPQELPIGVFLRRSVVYAVQQLATWLRFCLVITIWLGCLPYVIRQIWRLLFWFSDGGWPSGHMDIDLLRNVTQFIEMAYEHAQNPGGNATSPATPFFANPTTPASEGGIWNPLMRSLNAMNTSESEPIMAGLSKSLWGIPGLPGASTGTTLTPQKSSLLSGAPFISTMTRSPYLNQMIVTVAEGYVITLLVVVSFILVFLIREWVLQQQLGANMRANFNQDLAAADRPMDREPAVPEEPVAANVPEPRDVGQRPIARPRRRNIQPEDGEAAVAMNARLALDIGEASRLQRPTPTRDALGQASEIQRQLTEEPKMSEEFMAIWRRAEGNSHEVLRIIEEENKTEEMRYWVTAMRALPPHLRQARQQQPHYQTLAMAKMPTPSQIGINGGDTGIKARGGSDHSSSDSWEDMPDSTSNIVRGSISSSHDVSSIPQQSDHDTSSAKGKEREVDSTVSLQFENSGSATSRPRAVSDGPQLKDGISALANNNWSFINIPDTKHESASQPLALSENANPAEGGHPPASPASSTSDSSSLEDPTKVSQALGAEHLERFRERQERFREAITNGRQHELTLDDYLTMGAPPPPELDPDPVPFGPVTIRHLDGTERTYNNWDDVVHGDPPPRHGEESDNDDAEREQIPPQPDTTPLELPQDITPLEYPEQAVNRPAEPQGILETVADWLWGGVEDLTDDDNAEPEPEADELVPDPHPPLDDDVPFEQGDFAEQDREMAEAVMIAGIDPNEPDAMDDAEDLEGIMELIGMRGPLLSLAQNAIFSAFLLALTVAFGVWIPYNIGRVSLILAANPGSACKLPLRFVFWCAAFLQDLAATILGFISYCFIAAVLFPLKLLNTVSPGSWVLNKGLVLGSAALKVSNDAVERILHDTVNSLLNFKDSDMFTFSAASHESLLTLGLLVKNVLSFIWHVLAYPFVLGPSLNLGGAWGFMVSMLQSTSQFITALQGFFMKPDSWVISLEVTKRATPLNPELSSWGGIDRFWATVAGYATLCVLGSMYLKKGTPFSTGPVGREWEVAISEILRQAGGVMKVIFIISIEMLVFPLYCGLLLDAALLPLFASATITSRIEFTRNSPLTSIFLHWFVGTCYMFHFALFVTMCRKIMRRGVLHFIRDPDDPTFHPVRDVLERNIVTQLRKIIFSAFVYGALVVVCLGGVVWGIALAFRDVLPIHWSSNEPVLEFPIDLLFYNFLMPLAVRVFRPSDGLHAMYTWWFHQSARMLRLTWFLLNQRHVDEEGYNVRRTWSAVFRRLKGNPMRPQTTDDPRKPFVDDPEMEVYFRRDGRYVRAPASDQVRIPKGKDIFLHVDENNNRLDGKWDRPDGVHGRDWRLYKQVYIPPHFGFRICVFIMSLWMFAALTGVCITIVPLTFGRHIFSKMLPSHVRKNDVYAFSIGVYILGSVLYGILHLRRFIAYLISALAVTRETPQNVLRRTTVTISRVARILWTYTTFIFVLPTLFAFLVEFYAILPLHTYFSPSRETHTIHFVQSWTLGLLYVKLTTRVILSYPNSLPAISLRAITRKGYMNPDAKLATRAFILPGSLILCFALVFPYCIAELAITTLLKGATDDQRILIHRYVYPAAIATGLCCYMGWLMIGILQVWRNRMRDEVYLVGERLHDFGESKAAEDGVDTGARRIET